MKSILKESKNNAGKDQNGKDWKKLGFDNHYPLVGKSQQMKEIFALIKKVAKSNASVLIQGETGTGKELIANLIQFISPRSTSPYVQVNCAALPENLLESELFGHERGAFTGAYQARPGKFEMADKGTLFLDEIGDMEISTQAKILRVLQNQEFTRVGGNKSIKVDVRIISATNHDIDQAIAEGKFRADLFYRINVVNIHIPPLRERLEDIPLIADFFLRKFSRELRKNIPGFSNETVKLMKNLNWNGNIRELRNLVERAVLLTEDNCEITPYELPMKGEEYFAAGGKDRRNRENGVLTLKTLKLEEAEKQVILKALETCNYVQKNAAAILGISSRVLNYKVSQFSITHPSWRKNNN